MTKYWGGKSKIGKYIADCILQISDVIDENEEEYPFDMYWEPFLGMGGVIQHLIFPLMERNPEIELKGSDINRGVINFWNHVKNGKSFNEVLLFTDDDFNDLKETKDEQSAYHALVGHSCGFHGMYFSGRINKKSATPMLISALNKIEKIRPQMSCVNYKLLDFLRYAETHPPPVRSIIYLDPPYVARAKNENDPWGHKGRKNQTFDTKLFWDILDYWALPEFNNLIFVSETWAPPHWPVVWSKEWTNHNHKGRINRTENVYCNIDII